MDLNMWNHIIKYIPYPSKPLYKVLHNIYPYKKLYEKSIIQIQRFYRSHRAPRHNNIDIKNISKKMLIRVYMTQYPIDYIDDFLLLFYQKIGLNKRFSSYSFGSKLRQLLICLEIHSKEDIEYVGW